MAEAGRGAAGFEDYVEAIPAEMRPLFDRVHGIGVSSAIPRRRSRWPTACRRTGWARRRLNVGVWKHGVSIYGFRADNDGGFVARHPSLSSGKGTHAAPPRRCRQIGDDELRLLLGGALEP